MDIKDEILGYLIDIEEDKAADIIRESEFQVSYVDVVIGDFDEYDICSYQILIKGKYLKQIEDTLVHEKKTIEEALRKFAEIEKKVVQFISWNPLPRIHTTIKKYNQNDKMKQYLLDVRIDDFFNDVKSIFSSLSYQMKITEAYFHSNIHTFLKTIGFEVISEDETNLGRIDSVIELDDKIYIIEFKTSSAEIALEQIKSKKYFEKYLIKHKAIYLIGVKCSLTERNIVDWKVEKYL